MTGAGGWGISGLVALLLVLSGARAGAEPFRFDRDTLSFTNSTVFEYKGGQAQARAKTGETEKVKRYTRRCFVMSRSVLQFYKFARFEPNAPALSDQELAARVRQVSRRQPWKPVSFPGERVVFPGYANLRQLSQARARVLQENLGLGWPTYVRVGNYRMFFRQGDTGYQKKMHTVLNQTLKQDGFFIAYLSDYPHFRINHAILIYGQRPSDRSGEVERYIVYDPNHPDGPRELKWSNSVNVFNFQKDKEFPGGFTNVYQVFGKWLQ